MIKLVDSKTYTKDLLLNVAFGTRKAKTTEETKKIVVLFKAALGVTTLDG